MKVVHDYLNDFGMLIKQKQISPNRAWEVLAERYELSKAGVRLMLLNAGVYRGRNNPLYFPTEEERKQKAAYFLK